MVFALGGVRLWNLPHLIADIDYRRIKRSSLRLLQLPALKIP